MVETKIDLSKYKNHLGKKHQIIRLMWGILWPFSTFLLPRSMGMPWKRLLLRIFGAKIHPTAKIYSTARIYYPANLIMEENSCLADNVDCYNVDMIKIGANSTISQGAFLCTASHDISNPLNPLITAPILIKDQVWIGARAFIGMGVIVNQGAVVGATASVYKDVAAWTVVGGNPASVIKQRILNEESYK